MKRKQLVILTTAGAFLFLLVFTPIISVAHHFAMRAIAAVSLTPPPDGPHTIYLRINGADVHGVADDGDLWFAVVPSRIDVIVGHGATSHPSSVSDSPRERLSLNTNRSNPLELNGIPVSIPAESNIFAIDRDGKTHPIQLEPSTIRDIVRVGSSGTSIPPTLSVHSDSDFTRVVNSL